MFGGVGFVEAAAICDEVGDAFRVHGGVVHGSVHAFGHAQQREGFETRGFDDGFEVGEACIYSILKVSAGSERPMPRPS